MTKLRLSSKNLARTALSSLLAISLLSFCGCSSSFQPTFLKEDADKVVKDICKKEYNIDVKTILAGQTLCIYLPLEDVVSKPKKPSKYTQKFTVDFNQFDTDDSALKLFYLIKEVPEQEKTQEAAYDEKAAEKINNVWKVIRRVLFSMRNDKNVPHFFVVTTADIKKGFEITRTFYYLDLKKVSYEFISWTELYHRTPEETKIAQEIIGDKDGNHWKCRGITLQEFVCQQIKHRIDLKFQKPEVAQGVDIDKEVLKIVSFTLKTYGVRDFTAVELNNLGNKKKTLLNRAAIWARPTEDKP